MKEVIPLSKRTTFILIGIVAVLLLASIYALSLKRPYVGVDINLVKKSNIRITVHATGQVVLNKTRTLMSKSADEITEIHVTLGDEVKKDATLIEFKRGASLKAPMDGKIIASPKSVGDPTLPNEVLLSMGDFTTLYVDMDIHEYDAPLIKVDQEVKLTSNAYPDEEFSATISTVSPIATSKQGPSGVDTVVSTRAMIKNPTTLIPGNKVDCQIIIEERKDVLVVPVVSVVKKSDGLDYVYIVDAENKLQKRQIELGYYSNFHVEVLKGLEEGEMVLLTPKDSYSENMEVAPQLLP